MDSCLVCGNPRSRSYLYRCDECGGLSCPSHTRAIGAGSYCDECYVSLATIVVDCCGAELLRDGGGWDTCECGDTVCDECIVYCGACGERFCPACDDLLSCRDCGLSLCTGCAVSDDDGWTFCFSCNSERNDFEEYPPGDDILGEACHRNPYERLFGIEVETDAQYLSAIDFDRAIWIGFGAVEDGSLDDTGVEWVSPRMSGDAGFAAIEQMAQDVWRDCNISSNCGLHVHIDARDLSVREVAAIAALHCAIEDVLASTQPPYRRNGSWCRFADYQPDEAAQVWTDAELKLLVYGTTRPNTRNKYHSARYAQLNLHSWYYRGTLEFRVHEGTLDAEEIQAWVLVCQAIVAAGRKHAHCISDVCRELVQADGDKVSVMSKVLALPDIAREYIEARLEEWG